MTDADFLRAWFISLEVNATFSEAVLAFSDDSRLCFCHTVGERTVKATGTGGARAALVLAKIASFRLNAKHLDIRFEDGSRWEALLRPKT